MAIARGASTGQKRQRRVWLDYRSNAALKTEMANQGIEMRQQGIERKQQVQTAHFSPTDDAYVPKESARE
jgi:hypothetical protein